MLISEVNSDVMTYTELICIGFQIKFKSRRVRAASPVEYGP